MDGLFPKSGRSKGNGNGFQYWMVCGKVGRMLGPSTLIPFGSPTILEPSTFVFYYPRFLGSSDFIPSWSPTQFWEPSNFILCGLSKFVDRPLYDVFDCPLSPQLIFGNSLYFLWPRVPDSFFMSHNLWLIEYSGNVYFTCKYVDISHSNSEC